MSSSTYPSPDYERRSDPEQPAGWGLWRLIARVVSVIFHPLLMPTIGLLLLLSTQTYIRFVLEPLAKVQMLGIVLLNTFIVPAIIIWYLYRRRIIKSFLLETRQERTLPFLLSSLFFLLTYYMLKRAGVPPLIYVMVLGAVVSVLAASIINFFWKISAHMVGLGGLLGAFMGLSLRFSQNMLGIIMLFILVSGIAGWARIYLNAHKPSQVYAGFWVGFAAEFFLIAGV